MGFGSGIFVFLRPCQDGGENRKGRPGSREKEIGFETYPSFQKRDAHALRFGSMNPISRIKTMGAWGKGATGRIPLGIGAKVIIPGSSSSFFFFIAEMEFRPIVGWPKRAYIGDSGVENDDFEACLLWGFGTKFSCF